MFRTWKVRGVSLDRRVPMVDGKRNIDLAGLVSTDRRSTCTTKKICGFKHVAPLRFEACGAEDGDLWADPSIQEENACLPAAGAS